MRIVFVGAVQFSKKVLVKLIDMKADLVGACTVENSPFNTDHVDLTPICKQHDIPVRYTTNINSSESIDWIRSLAPDVIFCFGWSWLLKTELLNIAPLGVVGYHPAELPTNRGRHPLIWALVLGLKESASTFFFMDEGADSGDILSQQCLSIRNSDDAGILYERMTKTALHQIEEFLPILSSGNYKRMPQDHSKANYWRKRERLDGQIDWRMPAQSIHNLVRGLTKPYVGAHFIYDGNDVKVWQSETVQEAALNIEPGKILTVDYEGIVVKAGIDAVRLVHIEPQVNLSPEQYL